MPLFFHYALFCPQYLRNGKCAACNYWVFYNNPSHYRILIGSRLWSTRGQTRDWHHHFKVFLLHFKMADRCQNWDNILRDWVKIRIKKSCRDNEQVWEAGRSKKKPYSQSAVERDSPNTKLILFCLEFNKSNKQNVRSILIYFKCSTGMQSAYKWSERISQSERTLP